MCKRCRDHMEIRSPNPRLTEFPFLGRTFGKATTSASSHKPKACLPLMRRCTNLRGLWLVFSVCLFAICRSNAYAQSQYQSATDFAKFAVKLRESGLLAFAVDGRLVAG